MSSSKKAWVRGAFRISDYVILAAVILAGVASSVFLYVLSRAEPGGCVAVIQIDGETVRTYPLMSDQPDLLVNLDLPRGECTVEIRDARVRVLPMPDSVCPQHICSRTGWIEKPGEFIACVPNRLIIALETSSGGACDTLDAITP